MTLLELLLALSLTMVLLAAIGMAISMNLRTLEKRRTHVEEAQLARAVLRMISEDLRSAVRYKPVDFSTAQQLASDSASSLTGATGTDATGATGTGATGTGADAAAGDATEASMEEEGSIASGAMVASVPGIYGNATELQVDVSRLPRADEYGVFSDGAGLNAVTDIPSDVKTVAYFVKPELGATAPTTLATMQHVTSGSGGLARRSLSRVVSKWAMDNGDLTSLENTGEIVAPEVTAIEFRYFSGYEWTSEWDSSIYGGLPVAIEILLAIRTASGEPVGGAMATADATGAASGGGDGSTLMYRLVVRIPVAQPIEPPATEEPEPTDSSTSGATTP